ncbi:bifunctional NAD(P)/FAD-dependent oxidoreductase/class I SAM-dependent methyltransferase [Demequina aestuarii]|uniref:bifunctional NAD(P)/FAD-dependent oxidoreductase/class I SAM-dependent methyltransferase n=1 Tax=Demequina aestuarii TaxID=327095 RepID=UPI000780D438|nr:bifunctional NAD(P)/FAD-dependent oxidoreductase/class I SAM-dependent methyltransferase [Demequina aestuarii]
MTHTTWDCLIIGGGAAGLSAAQMLGRARRRTLVIDGGAPRNRFADHMHGVLGHDGTPPLDLLAKGRHELEPYGVEVRNGWVTDVTDEGAILRVATAEGDLTTRTILLATGITDELPDIPGLAERWGSTVLHCPYCHGWEVRDQRLGVLVSTPLHAHLGHMIRQWSDRVTVFAQSPDLLDADARAELAARGTTVVDSPVVELRGAGTALADVVTHDGAAHPMDALFAGGTPAPHDQALAGLGLDRDDTPWGTTILTREPDGATSHPRIWAAGNVVDPMATVPMAMSAGATAGARINGFLVMEDVGAAVAAPSPRPAAFWEQRYADAERAWSGRVNATVASAVKGLNPGTALDLGCGEGADVIWLARQGWLAHGLDISPTAIARARATAADAGAEAAFSVADLATWQPEGSYDLVTASFLHSPVDLPRTEVLARASAAVRPGGHLLLVTHAAPPPWAPPADTHGHTFLTARQEADALALDTRAWEEVRVEEVERAATGPDGEAGVLSDGVVLLRRR